MNRITTFFFLFCVATAIQAQLFVKPNGSTDSFVYVQDEILFVEQDVNLVKNVNNPDTEASIYLRREAQLIQGATGSKNLGTGLLSVFQEGSTNQWDYNYWASPVSEIIGGEYYFNSSLIYTPFGLTEAGQANITGGYDSVVSDGASNTPVSIPSYWFFWYPEGDAYQDFRHVRDTPNEILSGYGFTMKGVSGGDNFAADPGETAGGSFPSGVPNNAGSAADPNLQTGAQRYDFRGTPNSGNIPISILSQGDQMSYVGNPYPSSLDLNYFLLEHSTGNINGEGSDADFMMCDPSGTISRKNIITGIAYFWDSDPSVQSHFLIDYQGGYAMYSPIECGTNGMYVPATYFNYNNDGSQGASTVNGGTDDDRFRAVIPIAQGFRVESVSGYDQSAGILTFRNRHRVYMPETGTMVDHKRPSPRQNDKSDSDTREYTVIPKFRLSTSINDTYTRTLGLGFWPNSTPNVDRAKDAEIMGPLKTDIGILHNEASYGIDVRPFNIDDRIPLFLRADQQSTFVISAGNFENFDTEEIFVYDSENYNYYDIKNKEWSTTLTPGDYHGRFFLTFKKAEVLDTETFFAENFDVFQNNNASQLEIRNPNGIGLKTVTVFDISGKRVINERGLDNNTLYTFSTQNLQDAVYIVKITSTDNVESTQKITVSNGY